MHCDRVALFMPDELAETFEPGTDHGGTGDVRYLEWTYDPDPSDTWTVTEYAFVLRDGDRVRTVHETHRTGLFPRATWLRALETTGFRDGGGGPRADDRGPRAARHVQGVPVSSSGAEASSSAAISDLALDV